MSGNPSRILVDGTAASTGGCPEQRHRATSRRSLAIVVLSVPALLAAATTRAQPVIVRGITGNLFLDGLLVFVVLAVLWCGFYWGLYPKMLPTLGETAARAIFWPSFLLYAFCWLNLSAYTIYTYGFYHLWFQWTALTLIGFLSIWFLVSLLRT